MQRLIPALMVAVGASCVAGDSSCSVKEHVALVQRQASLQSKVSEDLRASTAAMAVDHWYLSSYDDAKQKHQDCDDACQASGYVCDADGFPHDQTSSEQVAAVLGVECQTWYSKGGGAAPYSYFWTHMNYYTCYYPDNSAAATCSSFASAGPSQRFCPCKSAPATGSPTASPTPSPTISPTTVPTSSPTNSPTNSPSSSPTNSPTNSPTASPTNSPTTDPTQYPTQDPTQAEATAIGDPHLVSTRGEHFSIFESGNVEFVRVPYELTTEEAEFTLHANIQSFGEGDKCKEARYITGLIFDGSWFEGKPLKVNVDVAQPGATTKEMKVSFGGVPVLPSTEPIDLGNMMFLHVHNDTNLALNVAGANFVADLQWYFLNVELSSIPKLAEKIGGLLGEDDHSAISKKPLGCDPVLLGKASPTVYSVARVVA